MCVSLRECMCVHVCILGKVPALELDNVNRSRWGNLNAHPLGYSRAGTKWEEVLEHLPARVDANTLAITETGWQREWKREWEIEDLWGVCLCVFSTVPLLFVLFAYLFFLHIYSFYGTIGPLSFCFASHLLRTNTRCVALWGCLSAFHIFCVSFYNI